MTVLHTEPQAVQEKPKITAAQEEIARIYLRDMAIIMLMAGCSLAAFVYYPSLYMVGSCLVAIGGVGTYLWISADATITMTITDKAVLVTGCDTG